MRSDGAANQLSLSSRSDEIGTGALAHAATRNEASKTIQALMGSFLARPGHKRYRAPPRHRKHEAPTRISCARSVRVILPLAGERLAQCSPPGTSQRRGGGLRSA